MAFPPEAAQVDGSAASGPSRHHNNWWFSDDGGHNFVQGNLPSGGGSFDYVRLPGSRSEPAGPCFALMNAPDPLPPPSAPTKRSVEKSMKKKTNGRAEGDDDDEDEDEDEDDDHGRAPEDNHNDTPGGGDDDDDAGGDGYNYSPLPNDAEAHDKEIGEMDPDTPRYVYSPGLRAAPQDGDKAYASTPPFQVVMPLPHSGMPPPPSSQVPAHVERLRRQLVVGAAPRQPAGDYAPTTCRKLVVMPLTRATRCRWACPYVPLVLIPQTPHSHVVPQAGGLAVDPTRPNSLYAMTSSCLAHSSDQGKSWSGCSTAAGLMGSLSKLLIKDAATMFMLRGGAVPLRTTDGGSSWSELGSAAPLFKYGATYDGSLSWSGETLVLSGVDLSAVGRGEVTTFHPSLPPSLPPSSPAALPSL